MFKGVIKKTPIILLLVMILFAGVFCYQSFQSNMSHCSGSSNSPWCDNFVIHGAIIHGAILSYLFITLSMLIVVVSIKAFLKTLENPGNVVSIIIKVRDKIPILSPIILAISNGIIHPRIP